MDQEPIQTPPIPTPVEPLAPSPRRFNPILILVVVILLVLVGVGGLFLGKSLNGPQKSTQPAAYSLPTQIPTPTPDPTANWKTYSNTLAKFEIKYPAEWKEKTSPTSGLPVFYSVDEKEVLFYNFGPKGGMSMGDTIDNFCKGRHMKEIRRLFLDNFPAVYCQDPTLEPNRIFNQVLVQKDDFQIEINGDFVKEDSENSLKIYNQILSTFKFLDQNQTSDITNWKTYRSVNGNFSLKYPQEYQAYENQVVSVDGMKVASPDTFQIVSTDIPNLNTNFTLTIKYINGTDLSLALAPCLKTMTSETFTLGKIQGTIYKDSPCGPFGSTVVLFSHNDLIYTVSTETHVLYKEISNYVDQILSTFRFTSP